MQRRGWRPFLVRMMGGQGQRSVEKQPGKVQFFSRARNSTTGSKGPLLISLVSVKRGLWGQVTQAQLEGKTAHGTSAVSSGSSDRQPFGMLFC